MLVMKFGGTSLGSAEAIDKVSEIIKEGWSNEKIVVVLSAMKGVTDHLQQGAKSAGLGNEEEFEQTYQNLLAKHHEVIRKLITSMSGLEKIANRYLDHFREICRSVSVLGELTPKTLDQISSFGERIVVHIMAALLEEKEIPAKALEADELILTDSTWGSATPLMDETAFVLKGRINPLLEKGTIPVVTGFIGGTKDGETTTLGRGGSDYTASIIGSILGSREIWIWTDVDGVMTADPAIVTDVNKAPRLSYEEMTELSYYGAKVLYPKSVLPAREASIPIRIKNTFNLDDSGTLIAKEPSNDTTVKAITSIKDLSLITVQGHGMLGVPGMAARVFSIVAEEGINILLISQSSSEQNICFVVERKHNEKAVFALKDKLKLELDRRIIERIESFDRAAIIAVVGAGLRSSPGIAAKVFNSLGQNGINIISIAQGSSEYNLSLVVEETEVEEALTRIHSEFF